MAQIVVFIVCSTLVFFYFDSGEHLNLKTTMKTFNLAVKGAGSEIRISDKELTV